MELQGKKRGLLLLLLIGSLGLSSSASATNGGGLVRTVNGLLNTRTTVVFTNSQTEKIDFTVHCKSKDDDLGAHVVPFGQNYNFSFRPRFIGSTLFFCGVTTKSGSVVFDAYKQGRDENRCEDTCNWAVFDNGVAGFKQGQTSPDLYFPWNK